jgi:suppressor of fused-like protein
VLYASLGGPEPLDGISAYLAPKPDHWHYVSYGMSELYGKESDDPEVSGWGIEFTFRLKRDAQAEPPGWVLNFLNNLARYVFKTGNVFDVGHHMDLNGPIALGQDTKIRAIAFVEDPQLGAISTPHGRVRFLEVVGLTLDEYEAVQGWDAEKFLRLLSARDPLLVTDLSRRSYLADPALAQEVEAGSRRDGSSENVTFVARVEWTVDVDARVTLGANAIRSLQKLLPRRLPYGRTFALVGKDHVLRFEAAETPSWRAEDQAFVVALPQSACRSFCEGLAVRRGVYRWESLPGLQVTVVPSEIKDSEGNVVDVIG